LRNVNVTEQTIFNNGKIKKMTTYTVHDNPDNYPNGNQDGGPGDSQMKTHVTTPSYNPYGI
jgi:hypothetical protein